jgi:Calx-beta domain
MRLRWIVRVCLLTMIAGIFSPVATGTAAAVATPTLSAGDSQVWEGDGYPSLPEATFVVRLSAPSANDVSFQWSTEDGTATHGVDYSAATASSTIAAGKIYAVIRRFIFSDPTAEPNETFFLKLTSATVPISRDTGTATIVNDDPPSPPHVSIGSTGVTEGDQGGGLLVFVVTISGRLPAFTVKYATADGTAKAVQDYVAISGTLSVRAGQRVAYIYVRNKTDTRVEGDEQFTLTLSNPTNGVTIGHGADIGTGTILNDDA